MRKDETLRARVERTHAEKIDNLRRQTGFTTSQIIRALIESAKLESKTILSVTLSNNVNGGASSYQAESTASV